MKSYVAKIKSAFSEKRNTTNAFYMKKYMRNKFDFFGIKSQLRREISNPFLKKENLPDISETSSIVLELWNQPERELQYFGMDFLLKYQSQFQVNNYSIFEFMITKKSWWDTVDFIASKLVGNYFQLFPKIKSTISEEWNLADNLWLNRTSILFQLKYKDKTDTTLLYKYILQHINSDEFFLQKAIGWALREYSKTDPDSVSKFVEQHKYMLSNLSKREALKIIKK